MSQGFSLYLGNIKGYAFIYFTAFLLDASVLQLLNNQYVSPTCLLELAKLHKGKTW